MTHIIIGYILLPILFLLGAKNFLSVLLSDDPTCPKSFKTFLKGHLFFALFLYIGHLYYLHILSHAGL